ncbi:integration host factor subunit alpha [bacterium]|nr:MAG: integration host factor subunit alpha [bacterium]
MNKRDMIDLVAKEAGITKKQADRAITALLDGIKKALKKGDRVTFVGFGTFLTRKRAPRKARNPRTGKEINIPAKVVPVFRAGSDLKKAVAKKK